MKKESFAEIYSQWVEKHNEDFEIGRKIRQTKKPAEKPTVTNLKKMKVQDEIDLHGLTIDEAVKLTDSFVNSGYSKGLLKVRIITGKGLHSENFQAVVRPAVISSLQTNRYVSNICTNPKPEDGGSGALIVYIKQK